MRQLGFRFAYHITESLGARVFTPSIAPVITRRRRTHAAGWAALASVGGMVALDDHARTLPGFRNWPGEPDGATLDP